VSFAILLRLFIEAIPVAVLGILITIHVLLFVWKCVRFCARTTQLKRDPLMLMCWS